MKHGDKRNFFIGISILFVGIIFLIFFQIKQRASLLVVSFLDVGQGDAIFIEAPNGVQVLVDSGPDAGVVQELSHVMPFWDRTIDMVIPSHADKDHIGGFPEVFKRFSVESVYDTENNATTAIYEAYEAGRDEEGSPVRIARSEDTIILDDEAGVYLRVLFPNQNTTSLERNDASTILQLVYGDIEVMLTGDAGSMIEEYLVHEYGPFLESEILKAGHHGSKTSSSPQFVRVVEPDHVVISAGKDNSYGHPHPEVMETLQNSGAKIFETQYGIVQFVTDGKEVWSK
jgi:competence protein ComEC